MVTVTKINTVDELLNLFLSKNMMIKLKDIDHHFFIGDCQMKIIR